MSKLQTIRRRVTKSSTSRATKNTRHTARPESAPTPYRELLAPESSSIRLKDGAPIGLDSHSGVRVGATAWLPTSETQRRRWIGVEVQEVTPEEIGKFSHAEPLFTIHIDFAPGKQDDPDSSESLKFGRATLGDLRALVAVMESVTKRLRAAGVEV